MMRGVNTLYTEGNDMEKIDVRKDIRYVAAVMDVVPLFLARDFVSQTYKFIDNISAASKCVSKEVARDMINVYRRDTSDIQDITILPIEVTYRILDDD